MLRMVVSAFTDDLYNYRTGFLPFIAWVGLVFVHLIRDKALAEDPFAQMMGLLRTFQVHACDHEELRIECLPRTVISVHLVHYGRPAVGQAVVDLCSDREEDLSGNGTECTSTRAFQVIERKCQEQMICRLMTSPVTFQGDPCPQIRKYAEVAYKCRPAEFEKRMACEGRRMTLSCSPSLGILIFSASYGYSSGDECSRHAKGPATVGCESSSATEIVTGICFGKSRCHVSANDSSFGHIDCPSSASKHLTVRFTCVPREVLRQTEAADEFPRPRDVQRTLATSSPEESGSSPTYKTTVIDTQEDTTSLNFTHFRHRKVIGFLATWLSAHQFIIGNQQKLILYVSLCLSVGIVTFVLIVGVHSFLTKHTVMSVDVQSKQHREEAGDLARLSTTTNRKISETVPRAPVSDGPQTNHFFS